MNNKKMTWASALALALSLMTMPAVQADEGDGGDACEGGVTIDLSLTGGNCNAGDGCDGEDGTGEDGCDGGDACEDNLILITFSGCNAGGGGNGGDGCDGQDSDSTIRNPSDVAGPGCIGGSGGDGGDACNGGTVVVTADGCNGGVGGIGGEGGGGGDCESDSSGCPGGEGGGGGNGGNGGDACNDTLAPLFVLNGGPWGGCNGGDGGCGGVGGVGGTGGNGAGGNGEPGEEGDCEKEQSDGGQIHLAYQIDPNDPVRSLKSGSASQSADPLAPVYAVLDFIVADICATQNPAPCDADAPLYSITLRPGGLQVVQQQQAAATPVKAPTSVDVGLEIATEIVCGYNPGFVLNGQVCKDGTKNGMCEGPVLIFILSDDQCDEGGDRNPDEDGSACDASLIITVMSNDNCTGEDGEKGCPEGSIRVYDPLSKDNCEGGAGRILFDLLEG